MKIQFKSKKFLFVYPDFEYTMTKNGMKAEQGGWYHEGIAQLSSIIKSFNWKTNLIHLTKPTKEDEFKKLVLKINPDIIGFSVRTGVRKYSQNLINCISNLKKFVIVGSYHASLWPDEVIRWDGVNAICIGEGENPIKSLLEKIEKKLDIDRTGSFWFKSKKKLIKNKTMPFIEDLDSLPLPDFSIFQFEKLIPAQIKAAVIVLTRGCPYNCTYCWNNFARNLYEDKRKYVRYRSPENCILYIKKVIEQFPDVKSFRFQDDLWPFYNDWFDKFSKLYIQKINKPFECHLRANVLNEKIIKRLKEMKCFGAYFGVESGNDFIRNKVLKRYMTEEVLINAFSICRKYGIRTHAYNIVGLPKENLKMVLDTIKLNAKLKPSDMFFPIFFPYAGTELHDIAVKEGFFDPKKEFDQYVNVEMPDFNKKQIRFASLYAKTFVRFYQFVFSFGKIGKPFEKILDFLWQFKYWPYDILIFYIETKRKLEFKLKLFIKKHFFSLYLFFKKR